MDHTLSSQESFQERFQRRLAESRFFAISLALHFLLVIFAGGVALYNATNEPPEFVSDGGDGLVAPTDVIQPPDRPPDTLPTETFQQASPQISSPSVDIISTMAQNNSFKVAPSSLQVDVKVDTKELASKNQDKAVAGLGIAKGLPGTMAGRIGSGRKKMLVDNKGTEASEAAVLRGLRWLVVNQNGDGSWGDNFQAAMTGLALLSFLGHGETPESEEFGLTVSKAVEWVLSNGTKFQGRLNMKSAFDAPGTYEHGICTYAMGEYYTMTKDERVTELLKQALTHIVQGQGPGGGWTYAFDKTNNDMSVTGWQIQALKAGHLSQLNIAGVDGALDKAMECVDRMKGPNGGYKYRDSEGEKYSLAGVGILSRLFWKGERSDLRKGMEWIIESSKKTYPVKYRDKHSDLYAWYYNGQAALMFGGNAWSDWNGMFQNEIIKAQSADGSWPITGAEKPHGPQNDASKTGAVYRTTLCILMLEVFYRYTPTTRG